MRILYIAIINNLDDPSTLGVLSKLKNQQLAFSTNNVESTLLVVSLFPSKLELFGNNMIHFIVAGTNLLNRRKKIFKAIYNFISKNSFNIIYFRYPLSDFWFLVFLKKLHKKNVKIITEHQTIEIRELKREINNFNGISKYLLEWIYRPSVMKYVDLGVCVTKEIMDFNARHHPNVPFKVMGNGINYAEVNQHVKTKLILKDVENASNTIRIGFVGNLSAWHGIDKLVDLAAEIEFQYRLYKIELHVIGEGSFMSEISKRSSNYINQNIFLYGALGVRRFEILYDMDVGIGSLAPDRRGLIEGSNLKLREYASIGLPIVKSDFDLDFENEAIKEFVFTKTLIDINDLFEILDFSIHMKKVRREAELKLKNFAKSNLDWENKIRNLINDFTIIGF